MLRVFISAFFVLALLPPVGAALYPADGDDVVVFAGATGNAGAAHIIAASDGRLLVERAGAVAARGDRPHFVRRLYAAGALLVVRAASGLCAPTRSTAT